MCFFFVRERWEEIEDRERVREGTTEICRESGERKRETKKGMEEKRERQRDNESESESMREIEQYI